MRHAAFVVMFILLSSLSFAQLNPKQITEAQFRIALSGELVPNGDIDYINLTLNIPQEGVTDIKVSAESWKYITDSFGNRLVLLEWKNPKGTKTYSLETAVVNRAKTLLAEKTIGTDADFLKENDQLRFTPGLRKMAFPYEKTLERAAELTALVHDYVNYDLSIVGQLKPSDWVYENRRGVCVEFANLLASLLRISGMPTRYVLGYAYSAVENKLIGHAWVEILAADGSWISLDPTWLEAGYLDATHIKTAIGENANQTEKLSYSGRGAINVNWKRNEDSLELLGSKAANTTTIELNVNDVSMNEYGLASALISSESCTIEDINITSCRGDEGQLLDILDKQRKEWVCREKQMYWVYGTSSQLNSRFTYSCPLNAYDQTGAQARATVDISGERKPEEISIEGPDVAGVKESFVLRASVNGTFFSPSLGKSEGREWALALPNAGRYSFYLYSNGAVATKDVEVVEKKEFSIAASAQKNVTLNGTFILTVAADSLLNEKKNAKIRVEFGDAVAERQMVFSPKERKTLEFNLTAAKSGTKKITASVMADSIASYSTSIVVYEQPKQESVIDVIFGFFSAIIAFIAGLLPK